MSASDAPLTHGEINRLRWSCRRGLLENDLFIERWFAAHGHALDAPKARGLTALLALSDPELLDLLLRRVEPEAGRFDAEALAVLESMRRPPAPGSRHETH